MRGISREFPARDSREFLSCSSEFMARGSNESVSKRLQLRNRATSRYKYSCPACVAGYIAPFNRPGAFEGCFCRSWCVRYSTASARTSLQSREVKLEKDLTFLQVRTDPMKRVQSRSESAFSIFGKATPSRTRSSKCLSPSSLIRATR